MRYKVNPEREPVYGEAPWVAAVRKMVEKRAMADALPPHQRAILDHLNAGHDLQAIVPRSAFKPTKKETT